MEIVPNLYVNFVSLSLTFHFPAQNQVCVTQVTLFTALYHTVATAAAAATTKHFFELKTWSHTLYSFCVDILFAISKGNTKILHVAFSSLFHTSSVLVTALTWAGCRRRVESYKCSSWSDCSHSSGCVLVCCHLEPDCHQCEIRKRDMKLQVRGKFFLSSII